MTNKEIKEVGDSIEIYIPGEGDVEMAAWVAKEISGSGSMLPKSTDDVLEMFREQRSVVLLGMSGELIAHAAVTFVYQEDKVVEVGGVIVSDKWRKKGYGKQAIEASLDLARINYPGWQKIALCNEQSLPIYLSLGSTIMEVEDLNIIPKEAWEACVSCPHYAETKRRGKICCDTLVLVP